MSRPCIWITIETVSDGRVRRDRYCLWADTWIATAETESGFQQDFEPAALQGRVANLLRRLMDALERRHAPPQRSLL